MRDEQERRAREGDRTVVAASSAAASEPVLEEPARRDLATVETPAHHRGRQRLRRLGVVAALAVGAALLVAAASTVTAIVAPSTAGAAPTPSADGRYVDSSALAALPVPRQTAVAPTTDICTLDGVVAALAAGDDEAAIVAAGGGAVFRDAVVTGHAPCIDLGDASRRWVVIDKLRPFDPIDFRPADLVAPYGVRNNGGGNIQADAADALSAMALAVKDAGAGAIGLESSFRSYQTQRSTYAGHVANFGAARADQVSARPGHSEHQTGLGIDVIPCGSGCGSIDDVAGSTEGAWIVEHAWEYGWIVRYTAGAEAVTGYSPEPWHLRYIGPELARAYHEGGWTSLEEFFGLPAAPDYAG